MDFWSLTKEQQAKLARKNCKTCKGKGYYWHEVIEGEYPEVDLAQCWCTKKELKK